MGKTQLVANLTPIIQDTARLHDINPHLYLTQLLMNLPRVSISDLHYWLPNT